MRGHDGAGRSHELVVRSLVHQALGVGGLREAHARVSPAVELVAEVVLVVNLVEGHPVGDLLVVALEARGGVALEAVDELTVAPSSVFLGQVERDLEVHERDHRLDAVGAHAVEDAIVEGQARLVGLIVVALGVDAAPVDRGAQRLESHLGEELDVLLKTVVGVDGPVVGIHLPRLNAVGDAPGHAMRPRREHVDDGEALAVLVVRTLHLMRRNRAAPEEIVPQHIRSLRP